MLRHLERVHEDQPRIGDSATLRDELVLLGQDPFMEFPASNLARVKQDDNKPLTIFVKYMGMLGPQGALPLATTEEAFHYFLANDDAFPRFLDIFNHRFLQLFFRAWANSRPIAQHDRPTQTGFSPISARQSAPAPNLTESRQRAGRRQARLCRAAGSAGEIRLAPRQRALRPV